MSPIRGTTCGLPALGAALALLALAGCASSSPFKLGEKAERRADYDRAVMEYSKALQQNPDSARYRQSLERARMRASAEHLNAGRRLVSRGLYKEAVDEFQLAFDLSGGGEGVAAELRAAEARRDAGTRAQSLDEVKRRARERSLPGLVLPPQAREPMGLSFRNASLREAYQALGRASGLNFVFDAGFQDQPVSLEVRDVPFEQALSALASAGRTFHRVIEQSVIQVIPDTPQKRREYEQQIVKTFFLSNADLKETIDLLRVVLGARRVAPLPGGNALTINDTPDKVAAAERILEVVDKKRAEVVVEVEILEVNRGRLKEYGIQIQSPIAGTEGVTIGIAPDPTKTFTLDDNPYKSSNLVVTGLPGVLVRLLETDNSTRILANPQLRASEGQTAQARFGDQVPVPVTTFTPIAASGLQQQPITSFEYKNVGVNIDITPRVHHDGEVSLQLKLEISQVGPLFQNLPTFNSRTVSSVLRLRDGETTILAGLISNIEREALSGTPGLASLPILGHLFSRTKKEIQETDIVMTMTPHVVRRPELTEEDLRSFQLGTDTIPQLFEIPAIPPVSGPTRPGPAEDRKIEPIRPPQPSPTPTPQQ
jgi:general secretion pathway protein D